MNSNCKKVLVDELSELSFLICEMSISNESKIVSKKICSDCIKNISSQESDIDTLSENFTKLAINISNIDEITNEPTIDTSQKNTLCEKIMTSIFKINAILLEIKAKRYEYNLFTKEKTYFIQCN